MGAEETQKVVCMFFLDGEYLLDERTGRRVGVAQPANDLGIDLDGDSLGHEIFAEQLDQRRPVLELRMGTLGEGGRIEVRLALQLHNTSGNPIGVFLLLFRVLQELLSNRFRRESGREEVVGAIAEYANDLGGEGVVEHLDDAFSLGAVGVGERSLLEVLPRSGLDVGNVENEVIHADDLPARSPPQT